MTGPVTFEVGEEVAILRGAITQCWEILRITKRTATGRYVATDARGNRHEFAPNGMARADRCFDKIEKLTPTIRETIEQARLVGAIEGLIAAFDGAWKRQPIDDLRAALKALGGEP